MNEMARVSLDQHACSDAAHKAPARAPSPFIGGEWLASQSGKTIDVLERGRHGIGACTELKSVIIAL